METGKTGKYLKYAVGEIILVVIGILNALWLNNLNLKKQKKKDLKKINRFLYISQNQNT